MGVGINEKKTYLKISKGKVRQVVSPNTPNAVEVEIKDDNGVVIKTRHELQYDYVEGVVEKVFIQAANKEDIPDNLCLLMADGKEKFVVQINADSSLATKLLNKFCTATIDWTKSIKLLPYFFEEDRRSAIVVEQGGNKIEQFFTKNNPQGCPVVPEELLKTEPKTTRIKNEIKKYMIDIQNFIADYFFINVAPNIGSSLTHEDTDGHHSVDPMDDDLPPSIKAENIGQGQGQVKSGDPGGKIDEGDSGGPVDDLPF